MQNQYVSSFFDLLCMTNACRFAAGKNIVLLYRQLFELVLPLTCADLILLLSAAINFLASHILKLHYLDAYQRIPGSL